MKKVSVIIPAYNCEKTLIQCLGNVVNQTLRDIEVIIVNDASTDGTWDIIMECEAQFPDLVMAINSDVNRGAGGARNVGLMYASGEYIGFVDSDDIVSPDMYEKLYNEAVRGNYDMVDCGYYNEKNDLAMVHTSDELAGDLNVFKRSELIASGGYLFSRIYKRELIFDSGIQFRENAILEDCEYLMFLIAKAKRIGNVKEILYNYRYFKESLSNDFNPDKYYTNSIAAMDAVYNVMSGLDEYEDVQMAVEFVIFRLGSFCTNMCLGHVNDEKHRKEWLDNVGLRLGKYIKLPYLKNKYILNKIKKEDIDVVNKIFGI